MAHTTANVASARRHRHYRSPRSLISSCVVQIRGVDCAKTRYAKKTSVPRNLACANCTRAGCRLCDRKRGIPGDRCFRQDDHWPTGTAASGLLRGSCATGFFGDLHRALGKQRLLIPRAMRKLRMKQGINDKVRDVAGQFKLVSTSRVHQRNHQCTLVRQ